MTTVVSETPGRLGLARGSTAVCVPVIAPLAFVFHTLESVAANTPGDVPLIVVDPEPNDPALADFLSGLGTDICHIVVPKLQGAVAVANAGLDHSMDADVVLLSPGALVFSGWLERLTAAARSDTTVATASALGNNAGPLSLWGEYDPLSSRADLERLASEVARCSPLLRPRVPTADGHAIWLSRAALELVGPLDAAFSSLRQAIVDISQRCLAAELLNIAVDDVLVASVLPELPALGDSLGSGDDRALLEKRYPYLLDSLDTDVWPQLERSLSAARRALGPLSVTIDARILRGEFSGAQAETIDLIETLTGREEAEVRAVVDPALGQEARRLLEQAGVELVPAAEAGTLKRSTVVHRPYQVTSLEDLELLRCLGERIVITHLDLIAFHNPSYFGSIDVWRQHRRVTRQALALADVVVFLSEHAAADAVREGVVERERVRVVPMVVAGAALAGEARPPARTPAEPFLFCIGNDYRHKNRQFAIRLLSELRELGWPGSLVFAGADTGHGSSRGQVAAYLASHPELAPLVHQLPAVTEAEKSWLYANAAAVVYPSVNEGLGLIPFEAARAGTPCLFAAHAALAETFPVDAALLLPWDAATSAARALPVLTEDATRQQHVELLRRVTAGMPDSDSLGVRLLEIYESAAKAPRREASLLAADGLEREEELARWIALKETMGDVVAPGTPVPLDAQRGLIAIAKRKRLRGPVFSVLGSLYRIARRP